MDDPPTNPYAAPTTVNPAQNVAGIYKEPSLKEALFSFEGRFNRARFWKYTIISYLIMFVLGFVSGAISYVGGALEIVAHLLMLVTYVVVIWMSFAVGAKRWHDRGKSGWFNLVSLIPLVGPIWFFIECGCLKGTDGSNQYGPDPLG